MPEARLSSSPSFNASLLKPVPDLRRIGVYLPPVPIDPIVEGGFEAGSVPAGTARCGSVIVPLPAVIRAGRWLQGGKVIKGDRFQQGMCPPWGARWGEMLPHTWTCQSQDLSNLLFF